MTPVEAALWHIETRLFEDLTLEDIARAAGVSPHHLCRAFAAATGTGVIAHLRARRISEAAKQLARGAPDILSVALGAGYASHEAFSRAFRDRFGCAPSEARARGTLETLTLTEAIIMTSTETRQLAEPRMEASRAFRLVGLKERYAKNAIAGIPSQWARFAPHIGAIDGQVGWTTYGVCRAAAEGEEMDYWCAVELADKAAIPPEMSEVRLAPRRYAVFSHEGHVSSIKDTWNAIFADWLPGSGLALADAPDFEVYDERFDPRTATGVVEIWVPVEPAG